MAPQRSLTMLPLVPLAVLLLGSAAAKPDPPIFGGPAAKNAFSIWLSVWRNIYCHSNASVVPELEDKDLPKVFHGKQARTVSADGGAATKGVVTEGMGYALLVEGIMASQGDKWALDLALGLTRSWLGMVQGSEDADKPPLGGADKQDGNASKVDLWPYGVSAIPGMKGAGSGPAGVPTWKFPRKACYGLSNATDPCHGSATDGDEDAILGMVYMASALNYSTEFVDIVIRSIVSFASADLGYPDMYRTLPDGKRVYVPRLGSQWGGLTPPGGKYRRERFVPDWCFVPSYFAPAHYRIFRDFLQQNWSPEFDAYLPHSLDGSKTNLKDLMGAFEGAIVAGYNILYYSSCESGAVSNWVGVEAACKDNNTLSCPGVPWAHTPYVGKEKGKCSASGTDWGMFGSEGSRMPWRVAMDYILYTEESEAIQIYDREGQADTSIRFNARHYLNRFVTQYKRFGTCDGGKLNDCDCDYPGCKPNYTQAINLCPAFEVSKSDKGPTPQVQAPGLTCDNVPNYGQSWWAGFMAYPTFTAFIAPYNESVTLPDGGVIKAMSRGEQWSWLEALANICDFTDFNEEGLWKIHGAVCQKNYFHLSQEVISTLIMSGSLAPVAPRKSNSKGASTDDVNVKADAMIGEGNRAASALLVAPRFSAQAAFTIFGVAAAAMVLGAFALRRASAKAPAEFTKLLESEGRALVTELAAAAGDADS